MKDLNGYVAVITGVTAGVGEATARAIVGKGGQVVGGARRVDRLRALERDLGESFRGVEMDVRNRDDSRRLVDQALTAFGTVDGLVANTGIGIYGGIMDPTDDQLAQMMDTNIAGTVWPIRAVVPSMLDAGHGDIVIISSVAGLRGRGNEAVYAATKHAQMGLAGGLDRELHGKGIRVSALCPGGIVTEFAMGAGRTEQSPELAAMMTADMVADQVLWTIAQPAGMRTLVHSFRGSAEED
ncbi:MAG: SDR family oxidoreductase [Beutenbergiaceae bacterium]